MPAHIKSMLNGVSLHVPVIDGALALGSWQGIYLAEHRASRTGARCFCSFLARVTEREPDQKTAGPLDGPAASFVQDCVALSPSIRPAFLSFRPEVVSGWARAANGERMAASRGATPITRAASLRNLDNQAVVIAERDGAGSDCGVGGPAR